MTHGVIERTSNLFYYFQSGAINESLADIMGEIVDHRFGLRRRPRSATGRSVRTCRSARSATWRPRRPYGQPDKMTSTRYDSDASSTDDGGVHTNSGVGNKTAYLISQGGTFNGVTVTGSTRATPA